MFSIQDELKRVPDKPGVYLMRDNEGKILYVGKAVVLKNRLKSYFQMAIPHNERITSMIGKIEFFEYIVTDTEYEALVLECNLIKRHKPKYNVLLKDDKGYPYIKITLNEKFPRIRLARKIEKDGAKYFGPFYSAWTVNTTIEALQKIFPLRKCDKDITGRAERPCLNQHIELCLAPCSGKIDEAQYNALVDDVCDFLNGKEHIVERKIEKDMYLAAENMDYERAAIYRDRLTAIRSLNEKQKVSMLSEDDFDMIALAKNSVDVCIQVFFVRGGRVIGREYFILEGLAQDENSETVGAFIKQFYRDNQYIPPKVYTTIEIDTTEKVLLSKLLGEYSGKKCEIMIPQKGEKKMLAQMVENNAVVTLENYTLRNGSISEKDMKILEHLMQVLMLPKMPYRIEAYDISNTGDTEITASMIVFENGKANRKEYRHFKMKVITTRNDTGSMEETIERRFRRFLDEDKNFTKSPDLILADGGLNQVGSVTKVLNALGLDIPVFGMIKDDHHRTRGLIGSGGEYILSKDLELWRFISSIQNEAHRFALEYNKKLIEKRYKKSMLDDIPGIGDKRKLSLLKHFGSVAALKKASLEDICQVDTITEKAGIAVFKYFNPKDKEEN